MTLYHIDLADIYEIDRDQDRIYNTYQQTLNRIYERWLDILIWLEDTLGHNHSVWHWDLSEYYNYPTGIYFDNKADALAFLLVFPKAIYGTVLR